VRNRASVRREVRIAAVPADVWAVVGDPTRLAEWFPAMVSCTVARDGWLCTTYTPGTAHDGTEGELYDLTDDPLQRANRWDDAALRAVRDDLVADRRDSEPPAHEPRLLLEAPV
jgi:hypothetical protein